MLATWLIASAWAGPTPMVAFGLQGVAESVQEDSTFTGFGGTVSAGVNAVGPLWVEGMVDVGWLAAGGVRVGLAPQLRVVLTPKDSPFGRFSLFLGGGADVSPAPQGLLHAGASVDVAVAKDWALRLEGGYLTHFTSAGAGRMGLGVVWSPRRRPEPEPVVEDDAVWLPYPACRWTGEEEARAYLRGVHEQERAQASATGVGQGDGSPGSGGLLVLASPGDIVSVVGGDGVPVPVMAETEGSIRWKLGAGLYGVTVVGGGRSVAEDDVLVDVGHATWVRLPPAEVQRIRFPMGSAQLSNAVRRELVALVDTTGGWGWEVYGSYSPEGERNANEALARDRAQAVYDALTEAGLPASRILLSDVLEPESGLDPESQRAVKLVPVPAGARPSGGAP